MTVFRHIKEKKDIMEVILTKKEAILILHLVNVPEDKLKEEAKKEYFKLSKIYHPDSPDGNESKMEIITEAYQVIKKSENYIIPEEEPTFVYQTSSKTKTVLTVIFKMFFLILHICSIILSLLYLTTFFLTGCYFSFLLFVKKNFYGGKDKLIILAIIAITSFVLHVISEHITSHKNQYLKKISF